MGIISILLGIIIFICSVALGTYASIAVVEMKETFATTLQALTTFNNTWIYVIVIGVCSIIGLLIGMNLIMHGLTYNKTCKIYKLLRKRGK